MMLANEELRTVLVTIHCSLRDAIARVTRANVLETLRITGAALQAHGYRGAAHRRGRAEPARGGGRPVRR